MTNVVSSTQRSAPVRLAITGTDTGVGKTVVACALTARAHARGLRVAPMKPVESGVAADDVTSDAYLLKRAAGDTHDVLLVRPYLLAEPLAPMVAATRANRAIDISVLDDARAALESESELLVVEGAGGLLVPITADCSYATLFARWQCDVVIVAANRLGVINHTLLTVQAARAAGLTVRGVVLTPCQPLASGVAESTNLAALRELSTDIPFFEFPWVEATGDMSRLAAAAEAAGLDPLLSLPT
ncbi:MAG: dethiobiotin synthase [Gemmatimonadaceae bacterium]|nr:dethiobiotin synthase [Gemmatimonadaceae bacterium]